MLRSLLPAVVALVATGTPALSAGTTVIGIGAFGGASIPIVQDDVETGSQFGARVPVSLPAVVTIEPYVAFSRLGDGEVEIAGTTFTRDSYEVTAFGVNAILGRLGGLAPFRFFPFVGIGSHELSRAASEDITEVGYNFGLGLASAPAPTLPLNVDLRGEFNMIVTGDTSRKFANVTLGVSYNVFSTP